MVTYNLALIGFGGVNRALVEIIHERGDRIQQECGFSLRVVGLSDLHLGSIISPNGIDLRMLAGVNFEKGGFAELSGGSEAPQTERVIKEAPADIVVEATYTNAETGQPAISHCEWALTKGRSIVTTNKGPVALAARALRDLAERHGVSFEYEGSVMSGTPTIRVAKTSLSGVGLRGFEGILNGTSNYVLGRMEEGVELAEAVKTAQAMGFAEADPTADIEGYDVRLKVVILANELLGTSLHPANVKCSGISALTVSDIAAARTAGERWKLVGSAQLAADGHVHAVVEARRVAPAHPLAAISGATNAVTFKTDLLGDVTISGPGAGRTETAFAVLSDIIAIHNGRTRPQNSEAA